MSVLQAFCSSSVSSWRKHPFGCVSGCVLLYVVMHLAIVVVAHVAICCYCLRVQRCGYCWYWWQRDVVHGRALFAGELHGCAAAALFHGHCCKAPARRLYSGLCSVADLGACACGAMVVHCVWACVPSAALGSKPGRSTWRCLVSIHISSNL